MIIAGSCSLPKGIVERRCAAEGIGTAQDRAAIIDGLVEKGFLKQATMYEMGRPVPAVMCVRDPLVGNSPEDRAPPSGSVS